MHRLLGELRSMAKAIPGCRGLFSQLQHALQHANEGRVKLNQAARDHIEDFRQLADDVAARPTRLGEIVPQHPNYKGTVDAAKSGMGGVWLPDEEQTHPPLVWRQEFPSCIKRLIVTDKNPRGTITNSDLELAGTIAHEDVLATLVDCREQTMSIGCDNVAAVAWRSKGSTTTEGAAAYLLREAGMQQRQHRYQSQIFYLPGPINHLADVASRRFDLTDDELLTYLNTIAPQKQKWQLVTLRPKTNSKLISALLRKRPERLSQHKDNAVETRFGRKDGVLSAKALDTTTRSSLKSPTSCSASSGTVTSLTKKQSPSFCKTTTLLSVISSIIITDYYVGYNQLSLSWFPRAFLIRY